MKKYFAILISLFIFFNVNCVFAAYYENSDGKTAETAFVINNAEDFKLMRDRINASDDEKGSYYKLNADIDISSETNWIGILDFQGVFDGQNHVITVNISRDYLYTGLFENISNSSTAVKNLKVTGSVTGGWAGGFVWGLESGTIENCSFSGTVQSTEEWAGGFVDLMLGGTIRNCNFNGKVVSSTHSAAGFVSELHAGNIENCTVTTDSEITGPSYAGGIIGLMHGGYVKNCTTEVNLSAESKGGIVGGATAEVTSNLSGNKWPNIYTQVGGILQNNSTEGIIIRWNGHRYQIYNENLTWEQAKARCEQLGGHLVTITSEAEQNFINTVLQNANTSFNAYWIGAKADELGWWKWVTDEVFEKQYENFTSGQPDGSGIYLQILISQENGSAIQSSSVLGEWDDTTTDTTIQRGYICEWDDEQEVATAPLSSEFQQWQENPDAWQDTTDDLPTGSLPNPVDNSHLENNPANVEIATLPTSYDSRITHGLPPIRNQGGYRTCWAFAALGAMEADYIAQKMSSLGTSPDISELHLAWFLYKDPSSDFYSSKNGNGVLMAGGNSDKAVSQLNKITLYPVNESEMPYTIAGDDQANADSKVEEFVKNKIFDTLPISLKETNHFGYVKTTNTDDIKRAIMQHGAVFVSYHDILDDFNADKTAFYSTKYDATRRHAVLLVGWNDDYETSNFKTSPSKKGAWLVRNSRGTTWGGEDGYFWMSYAQADVASGMEDARAFIISEDIVTNNTIVQNEHDENGKTKNITSKWSAGIFKAERNESLIRAGFYTTDNNVKYQIFVNNFGKLKPTDPGEAEIPILSGDIPYAGYHTIELPEGIDLYNGDYYSVIVKLTLTSSYKYPTAVEASIDKYVNVEVKPGESFFAEGEPVPSVWIDGAEVGEGPFNACIKAFTIARASEKLKPEITTSVLSDATVGEEYNFTLYSTESENVEWRSGNIPSGLALSRTGTITGSPQEPGDFDVKILVFNDVDVTSKTLKLTVKPAYSVPSTSSSNGGGCNLGLGVCYCVIVFLFKVKRK
ncbi:MAG: hypothetical protein IJS40_00365 [Synergistaceae bacterium]|nr:hypothetical protein [Synergistaceae bacterium]